MKVAARAAIWLALAALSFVGLQRSLWTPDEPREAEIGREMLLSPGVVPTLDRRPFVEKPPLYYWAVAGAYALAGGPSAAAARAVSGAAGLLTLLVLAAWARRAASPAVALVAVLLLATSVQFALSTHWVLLDPLLMLVCTLALWAGWERLAGRGAGWLVLFYAALTLALWTKGPIGPVLVGAGLAAHFLLARRERPWRALHPFAGAAFLALMLAGVGVAIWLAGGWESLRAWGWQNQVQRLVSPHDTGHRQPLGYYLSALPVAVLPWLVLLIDLFTPAFWRRLDPDRRPLARYCAALAVGGVALLSLSATKRETYLLPLLPPLFLLLALAVEVRFATAGEAGRWRRAGTWTQLALAALCGFLPGAALIAYTHRASAAAVAALAVALALAAGGALAAGRRRLRRAGGFAVGSAALLVVGGLLLAAPALERDKDYTAFLRDLDGRLPAGEPVAAVGADETLLGIVPFVTGRWLVDGTRDSLGLAVGDGAPEWVLLQIKGRLHGDPELAPGYRLVTARSFGSGRHFSLWRRETP